MEIVEAINIITEKKRNLGKDESYKLALRIMNGKATDAQIASIITGLKMNGETVDEIYGFVKAMREKSIKLNVKHDCLIDTCGTGGDKKGTFNISTISAFVVAGSGVNVAKHGNRSISSRCGSADVLEQLGIKIDPSPKIVEKCIEQVGIGFLYAPYFHPAMKYVMNSRREIKVKTIFNMLGPLTNPAHTKRQVIGVFDQEYTETFAEIMKSFDSEHCLIVCGNDGLDEVTITDKTKVTELKGKMITTYYIEPEDFGLKRAYLSDISGGTPEYNAELALGILSGNLKGAKRDIVLLNSGLSIYVSGKVNSISEGMELAIESIDSGKAMNKLQQLIKYTNSK